MKILDEHTSYYRITKEVEIETDKGLILNVCVSGGYSDDDSVDRDSEFTEESQTAFDKLDEEEQDEIMDFINDIKL